MSGSMRLLTIYKLLQVALARGYRPKGIFDLVRWSLENPTIAIHAQTVPASVADMWAAVYNLLPDAKKGRNTKALQRALLTETLEEKKEPKDV